MTAPVVSRNLGYLGLARESTPYVPVAPTRFYKYVEEQTDRVQGVTYYRDGNERDLTYGLKETFSWGGNGVRHLVYADEGVAMLAWAMGHDVVTGTDPYLHTLTFTDGIPLLALEKGIYEAADTSQVQDVERVDAVKVDTLTIAGQTADFVTMAPRLIGTGSVKQASASTVVFSDAITDGPMMFSDGAFTITGPTDAATLEAQIAKFALRIWQDVRVVYGPGQLQPIGLLEQRRQVSLGFTAVFTGPAVAQLAYYGGNTGTSPDALLGTGAFAVTFTATAAERVISINVPVLDYTTVRTRLGVDALEALVDVVAQPHKLGATLPLTATALNGTSEAYC